MPGAQYDHHIAGRALIKYDLGQGLVELGYSLDGVNLSFQRFLKPIPGDQNGGPDGPPVDYIMHGEICDISFILIDFNMTNYESLIGHLDTFGRQPDAGELMYGGTNSTDNSFRFLVLAAADPYNFPVTILTNPHSLNLSTNEEQVPMTLRAQRGGIADTDVLFNASTT